MAINAQRSSTLAHPRQDQAEQGTELGESDRRASLNGNGEKIKMEEKGKILRRREPIIRRNQSFEVLGEIEIASFSLSLSSETPILGYVSLTREKWKCLCTEKQV